MVLHWRQSVHRIRHILKAEDLKIGHRKPIQNLPLDMILPSEFVDLFHFEIELLYLNLSQIFLCGRPAPIWYFWISEKWFFFLRQHLYKFHLQCIAFKHWWDDILAWDVRFTKKRIPGRMRFLFVLCSTTRLQLCSCQQREHIISGENPQWVTNYVVSKSKPKNLIAVSY